MKILCLRLSNLASIAGEHCIDFESEPLANAGLIAITGKTGAGKSTLLDAMCLALFDQIPRLNGALGSLTDVSGQDISIKDTKHILRRGAISGFSEVEFIALDQKRYRARWDIRRSYKKLTGNLKVDRSVTCLEDHRVLTQKISECTPCIQSLIGLSFEQFTRAVLLAQSEVGAFLKAKDHERAALLEYLTNSNIFSLVSQRAFEKTKEIKIELDKKQEFSQHIQLLSAEDVEMFEQNKETLEEKIKYIQQQQQRLEYAQQWQDEAQRLEQEINQQQLISTQIEQEKHQLAQQKQQLEHLDTFTEIRNTYQEQITAKQQQTHFEQQLQVHTKQFDLTKTRFTAQQQQRQTCENDIATYEQKLEQLQPELQKGFELDAQREHHLTQYQKIQDELHEKVQLQAKQMEALNQIDAEEKELLSKKELIETNISKYQFLSKLSEEPKANIDKLHHIQMLWQKIHHAQSEDFKIDIFKSTYQSRCKEIESQIKQYGSLEQLEENHQILRERQRVAEQLDQQLTQYSDKKQLLLEQQENLKQQQQTFQHASNEAQKYQHAFEIAEKELQTLQKIINEQKLLQSEHITALRDALKTDESCPVCGSKDHPFVEKKVLLEQAMQSIHQHQEEEQQNIKDTAFANWQASQQKYARLESHIEHLNHTIAQIQQEQTASWHQIEQILKKTTFNFSLEQLSVSLNNEMDLLKKFIQNDHEKYRINDQIIKSLKQQLKQQSQEKECINHIEAFEKLTSFILEYICDEDEKSQWKTQPSLCIDRYIQGVKQLTQAENDRQKLVQQLENIQHRKQQQQLEYSMLATQYTALEETLKDTKQKGLHIREQIDKLIQQHTNDAFTTVSAWQSALYAHKNQLHAKYQTVKEHFSQIEQQYHTEQTTLNTLRQSVDMWQSYAQEHAHKQEQWKSNHPLFTQTLIQACLETNTADIQQLRQHVQHTEQQHIRHETACHQTQQNYLLHQQKKPQCHLDELEKHLQENQQLLQEVRLARDEINAKLMSNQHAKAQQQHYAKDIEQLQQQVNRWGKISELIGSKDGAKFRRIAQEHHLDILIEYANQQLQPLSTRYALKRIENSLGLAIIDHEMNSEVRPVLSLSGGETFLVSLALAIAIANMASGAMRLESLFIDEGFGTLDPSSLHIVMDALDRLQSQGRKVVLISHVQEMHERIPVQVQVKSVGSGTSQIQVVG